MVARGSLESRPGISRRALLAASGAGGAACLLAGCGSSKPSAAKLPAGVLRPDVPTLQHLIDVEYYAASAYVAGIPLLSGTAEHAAKQFLKQELSHIAELSSIVVATHTHPHTSGQNYDFGRPRDATEVLELLHRVELETVRAYLAAIPQLSQGLVKAAAASILANDAQHASVVRLSLGLSPVPAAFVTGHD